MAKRRLTQRQKQRIQAIQEKRRQRLEERVESALQHQGEDQPGSGRVITRHGQNFAVEDQSGALHHCLSRQNIGHVVCGDQVVWQQTSPGHGVITARLERSSALIRPNYSGEERPLAANISQLVVVLAPEPEPSSYLLDQYLVTAENIGVKAILALNKCDLMEPDDIETFDLNFAPYQRIGYPLVNISAKFEHGLDPLIELLRDETSILVGQSGVGKSSLVKALLPTLEIQTGRLSEASGMGRHTTTATTLYKLPEGGELIDSPGVRSFRFSQLTRQQLELGFREIRDLIGHCRFSNCSHQSEPDCALNTALERGDLASSRLRNFLHMAAALSPDYTHS